MDQLTGVKAMVFAAGLGTRLRPLTLDRPKALVEVEGMSLLEIQLRRLLAFGISEVVVNIHHFPELMRETIANFDFPGLHIQVSDESGELLETGGGLKKAAPLLKEAEAILILNVDVLTNLNLSKMVEEFKASEALAMLAIRKRETSRHLVWDDNFQLKGWKNIRDNHTRGHVEPHFHLRAFSGIQLLRPAFLELIQQEGKFSIIDTYLDLASSNVILGYPHDDDQWLDVGKPPELARAKELIPFLSI